MSKVYCWYKSIKLQHAKHDKYIYIELTRAYTTSLGNVVQELVKGFFNLIACEAPVLRPGTSPVKIDKVGC